jgi:hypothetical protein
MIANNITIPPTSFRTAKPSKPKPHEKSRAKNGSVETIMETIFESRDFITEF